MNCNPPRQTLGHWPELCPSPKYIDRVFVDRLPSFRGASIADCSLSQFSLRLSSLWAKRLADVRAMISNKLESTKTDRTRSDRNRLVKEEKQLSESYMALATSPRKMMETSQRSAALHAMVRHRMRASNSSGTLGRRHRFPGPQMPCSALRDGCSPIYYIPQSCCL